MARKFLLLVVYILHLKILNSFSTWHNISHLCDLNVSAFDLHWTCGAQGSEFKSHIGKRLFAFIFCCCSDLVLIFVDIKHCHSWFSNISLMYVLSHNETFVINHKGMTIIKTTNIIHFSRQTLLYYFTS